jgi:hypothetical protein
MSTVTENLPLLRRDISRKQLTHRYRAAMVYKKTKLPQCDSFNGCFPHLT